MADPVFVFNGANRQVVAPSSSLAVAVYAPDDTAVELFLNGVSQGAMTNGGGGNFTKTITTPTATSAFTLVATGNITGDSETSTLTSSVNNIGNFGTWGNSGWGAIATSGKTARDGTPVYKFTPYVAGTNPLQINKTASPANAIANSGFEFEWHMPPTCVLRSVQMNFGLGGGYIHFDTEETTAGDCYIQVMERWTDGDGWDCKRIQLRRTDLAPGGVGSQMYLYFGRNIGTLNPTTTAGERTAGTDVSYFSSPKMIGDVALPFNDGDKISAHYGNSMSGIVENWYYKWARADQESHMAGGAYPGGNDFKIIKPPGWTKTGNYPLILFLPPLPETGETGGGNPTVLATIQDATALYATTYGAVVIAPQERAGGSFWWGKLNTGLKDYYTFIFDALIPWARKNMGVGPQRRDIMIVAYSKSANAALSMLLQSNNVGGIVIGDTAYNNAYPDNIADQGFGTSGQYALFDPKQIIDANLSKVNDVKRITVSGAYTWTADQTSMLAAFDAKGVLYDKTATTWTRHSWGPTGTNNGWTPIAVANMFSQRASWPDDGDDAGSGGGGAAGAKFIMARRKRRLARDNF